MDLRKKYKVQSWHHAHCFQMWLHFVAALALLCVGMAGASETRDILLPTDEQNLRRIALELRDAILREDTNGILGHISRQSGLGCTDANIPFRSVKKYLHNKASHLYMSLFDSSRFAKQCGNSYPAEFPAIADREFFMADKDPTIEIVPLGENQARVIFRSRIKGHHQREWDFRREGKSWKLIYGLIVGSCGCG